MEKTKFVLHTKERVTISVGSNQPFATLRIVVGVIIAIIIVGSLGFGDNLFLELSWTTRMILIALAISVGFWKPKKQQVPSSIELHFFENYMIVYREKRYYTSKVSRMEYNKFIYSDIERVEYDYRLKRLDLIGKVDSTWFNYNKDGTVPQKPTYHRVVDGGICYFYVIGEDADEILTCIEQYASKQPIVKNKMEVSQ